MSNNTPSPLASPAIAASSDVSRRRFLETTALAASAAGLNVFELRAAETGEPKFEPDHNMIPAPDNPAHWPAFRRRLAAWREAKTRELNYSDALYRRADFAWITGTFTCFFLMLCEETFYNNKEGRYTVRSFLDEAVREFGGMDSIVLWHAYPRIGLDERNQFDFYRDMPGGLAGLRGAVAELQAAGVKVLINYNPWDTGTRREGKSDVDTLCDIVGALDADGIFLDTMDRGASEFREKLDAVRAGVVLEGEIALPLDRVHDHHMGWAQGFGDSAVPGVLRNKWFERRHLQHQIDRWAFDHSRELQAAWMNGSGMMLWENVFGSWIAWCPRDKSILRQMLPIQRRYKSIFCGEDWTPLVPTAQKGTYASLWQGGGLRLWTLVNREYHAVSGTLLSIEIPAGGRVFDLVQGREIPAPASGGTLELAATLDPRGAGCFIAGSTEALGPDFDEFVSHCADLGKRKNIDSATPRLETRLLPSEPSRRLAKAPEGMAEIPGGAMTLKIEVRERECGFYESAPVGGPMLRNAYAFTVRQFTRPVVLKPYAIDLTPVTNAEFARFLESAKYKPRDAANFLNHWGGANRPPEGLEDHPLVYVSLEDARAYAKWAGRRLPTEEEWQFAAQGTDGRKFPWGNDDDPERRNGGEKGGTTPVRAFPAGRSPFGLYDMSGNTWEWTESERTDGHTRFCMLRGGSYFTARGSGWYADGGARPADFSEKFLLMWPGLDRCATVGFRCAVDLA